MKNKTLVKIKRWFVPLLGGAVTSFTFASAVPAEAACGMQPGTVLCNTPMSYWHYTKCLGIFPATLYKIKYAAYAPSCVGGYGSTYGSRFTGTCSYVYKWLTCISKGHKTYSINYPAVNCYTCG